MARNLEHQDLVWHPDHGIMMVVEPVAEALADHPMGDILEAREGGVWTVPEGCPFQQETPDAAWVPILAMVWFEEWELARVGVG